MKGDKIPIKKHYPKYSFRIGDDTKDDIKRIKFDTGLSYNLIFREFIELYKEKHNGQ